MSIPADVLEEIRWVHTELIRRGIKENDIISVLDGILNRGQTVGRKQELVDRLVDQDLKNHRQKLRLAENTNTIPKPDLDTDLNGNAEEPLEEEPNVQFKPVQEQLPELVQEKTGEEGEQITFSCRAKLYLWKDDQWKERGLGNCRVLQNCQTFQSRIVMRREQVKKVCLNLPLTEQTPDINFKKDTDDKALTFGGMDFSDMENDQIGEATGQFQKLVIRFKTPDYAHDFQKAYRNGCANSDAKSDVIYIQPESQIPVSAKSPDRGTTPEKSSPAPKATFSFGDKPAEVAKPFGGFSFSAGGSNGSNGFKFGSSSPSPLNFDNSTPSHPFNFAKK